MKSILLYLIIMSVICVSCKQKIIAEFEIANQSGLVVDSLKIFTSKDKLNFSVEVMRDGDKVRGEIDMTDATKIDGHYILQYKFTTSDSIAIQSFGYYTNGFPTEELISITIFADSIGFESLGDSF